MLNNAVAATLGLVLALAFSAYMAREAHDGWRKGRLLMRGPTTVTRKKTPGQFFFGLIYLCAVSALALGIAIYCAGRLAGFWSVL